MKIPFVIFDRASGEIRRWGACPSRRDVRATVAGAPYRIARATAADHHVVGRKLVAYTPEQAQRKAAAPSYPAAWSNERMGWVDARPPGAIEAEMLAVLRLQRDQALAASDILVLRAIERSGSVPLDLKLYRQALRDITKQPDLTAVTWPTAPE